MRIYLVKNLLFLLLVMLIYKFVANYFFPCPFIAEATIFGVKALRV
jgi:hypothetical protein